MRANFEVEFLPEAVNFMNSLDNKIREKIYYNIKKSQFMIDRELFKKLNDIVWEFRTTYMNKTYRLFAFWDNRGGKEALVIATHGLLKKTAKTPLKEIKKAEDIRKRYFNSDNK